MTNIVDALENFLKEAAVPAQDERLIEARISALASTISFDRLVAALTEAPAFSETFGRMFAARDAVAAISACRMLRGCLNMPLGQFFLSLAEVFRALEPASARIVAWLAFADEVADAEELAGVKLLTFLTKFVSDPAVSLRYHARADQLVMENPHAIYPTSSFRTCTGCVESTPDGRRVEAVMSFSTFSSIRVVDRVLDPAERTLRDIYRPLGRCVCFIDQNVVEHYGPALAGYFSLHGVRLDMRTYRAMEVDKGIATVEKMLGDLKALGVGRHEPVLIMGGGVLADTGGLACALYGRNTPYVMLSTSIVSGIDAGPSPRTCCDGFGYKNLLGAYHPPVVSITDRFFFSTLREGWLRHGVAEIVKMAIVKNLALFEDLERAQARLVATKFGTVDCAADDEMQALSQNILAGALKSYIEAEYDNLYETHQRRPHAYGHTWSPGFEIKAGLLHGHAVAVCMGLGAYLSFKAGWIEQVDFERILRLMENYGLSLWHDVLRDRTVMTESHRKIIQKRGGNLVAPLPRGGIGQCGYLNELSELALFAAIAEYEAICARRVRGGRGIEPLCLDVGLEDPSTVTGPLLAAE